MDSNIFTTTEAAAVVAAIDEKATDQQSSSIVPANSHHNNNNNNINDTLTTVIEMESVPEQSISVATNDDDDDSNSHNINDQLEDDDDDDGDDENQKWNEETNNSNSHIQDTVNKIMNNETFVQLRLVLKQAMMRSGRYILLYFFSSISMTLFVKYTVSYSKISFPLTLLGTQHAVNTVLCYMLVWYMENRRYMKQVQLSKSVSSSGSSSSSSSSSEESNNHQSMVVPQRRRILKWETLKQMVPFGVMSAVDYGLSNLSFLFITVTLYTMVKCSSPVFVLLTSFFAKIESPKKFLILSIVIMSLGVGLATGSSVDFHWIGFLFVLCASVVSGLRLVYVQTVLQSDDRVSSMVVSGNGGSSEHLNSLEVFMYSAPVLALSVLPFAMIVEGPKMSRVFPSLSNIPADQSLSLAKTLFVTKFLGTLMVSSFFGFCLNLSEFLLIKQTSSLTYTVVSTVKELLMIAFGVIVYGDKVTLMNISGFCFSLIGVLMFKLYRFSSVIREKQVAEQESLINHSEQELQRTS